MPRTIKCAKCGREVIATGQCQKYCLSCAYEIRLARAKNQRKKKGEASHTKHIKCEICGADVVVNAKAARAKYCRSCSEKAYAQSRKKSRIRKENEGFTVSTICNRCGVEFSYQYKGRERVLCPDCMEKPSERFGGRKKGGRHHNNTEPEKPRVSHIDDIQRAAHAAGMSYGKYKAMLAMQAKKKGA